MGRPYSGDVHGYYFTNGDGNKSAIVKEPGKNAEIITSSSYQPAGVPAFQRASTAIPEFNGAEDLAPIVTVVTAAPIATVQRSSFERSKEYYNALDYRAFIRSINKKYNSPDQDTPSNGYTEPFAVCGAPSQKKIDTEECRRYLKMRWSEETYHCTLTELQKEALLRTHNIEKLLAKPQSVAALLGISNLFAWDPQGSGNFTLVGIQQLHEYGYN